MYELQYKIIIITLPYSFIYRRISLVYKLFIWWQHSGLINRWYGSLHRWVRLVELGGGHKLFYFRGGLKKIFDAGEIFWLKLVLGKKNAGIQVAN